MVLAACRQEQTTCSRHTSKLNVSCMLICPTFASSSGCVACRAQLVKKTTEDAFPGSVVRVHAVYDTSRLVPLTREFSDTRRRLADLLDDYTSRLRRHRSVKRRKARLPHPGVFCMMDNLSERW